MTYNILSAQYANPEHTAMFLETSNVGQVAVSQADRPDLWAYALSVVTPSDYVEPVPPIPTSVTARQARLALFAAGLLATVEAAIAAEGGSTAIEWEYASTIERASPLVTEIASSLGLTEEQLDELFAQAAGL
jgi:hypothetical protein